MPEQTTERAPERRDRPPQYRENREGTRPSRPHYSQSQSTDRPKNYVTMSQLLECGVHFGHQTKRWNPKMKKFIFTSRNDIHVIDLQQTLKLMREAYTLLKNIAANKGRVLFVGTKKQAKDVIEAEAKRCDMYYVNQRWLGGTLTNFITLRRSIGKLKTLERLKENGGLDNLSKKESAKKTKLLNKLNNNFSGIKNMVAIPDILIVFDTQKEILAIKEAQRLNIPIIGIVDTNADPTEVTYPIPANDDAIRALKLISGVFANALIEGSAKFAEPEAGTQAAAESDTKEATSDNIPVEKEEQLLKIANIEVKES
jgi:small subunit ribosomal protein S2